MSRTDTDRLLDQVLKEQAALPLQQQLLNELKGTAGSISTDVQRAAARIESEPAAALRLLLQANEHIAWLITKVNARI